MLYITHGNAIQEEEGQFAPEFQALEFVGGQCCTVISVMADKRGRGAKIVLRFHNCSYRSNTRVSIRSAPSLRGQHSEEGTYGESRTRVKSYNVLAPTVIHFSGSFARPTFA